MHSRAEGAARASRHKALRTLYLLKATTHSEQGASQVCRAAAQKGLQRLLGTLLDCLTGWELLFLELHGRRHPLQ
jgi:hypothetical protein